MGARAILIAAIAGVCAGMAVGGLFALFGVSNASIGNVGYRLSVGFVIAVVLGVGIWTFRYTRRRLRRGEQTDG